MNYRLTLLPCLVLAAAIPAGISAQLTETERNWNEPVAPFQIHGNTYYVGAKEIAAYLIVTPAGHVVIDSGFEQTAPQILQNIGRLGFRADDVKILLNTQAHFDHIAGMAQLKRLTGARLIMSRADAELAARGGRGDFGFADRHPYPPVRADRIVADGETVELGGVTLTANITPGHTKGCTTWSWRTAADGPEAAVLCSVSVPGYSLVNNTAYPRIVEDYRTSFRRLRTMSPDIFLASHGSFFDLSGKRARAHRSGEENPFLNAEEWLSHLDMMEKAFQENLATQLQTSN